ncbi:MAG: patatin-like phospholipase family protein [Pseudomonadota bacterium]
MLSWSTLHRAVICGALIGISLLAPPIRACDFDDDDGPDIGLVLSGGGALASTQIGVLQVLEELGVPIHCISGTSMGSVVGALYATGYRAEEIEQIFAEAPWNELFNAPLRRRDNGYLEKERRDRFLTGYVGGIGEDGSFLLPGGLASMSELKAFYRSLLFAVPRDSDFDELVVPFRAVATDISTGEAHVFRGGDLVEAVLASMALPAVFAPREIDGRAYLDGGLAQNLPVQAVLDMGADIVIAIDLTLKPPELEPTASIADVTQQLGRLLVWQNHKHQLALLDDDDLLIRPESEGFSITAFDRVMEGVARGRAAVEASREGLEHIRRTARPASRAPRPEIPSFEPQIAIANSTVIDDDAVLTRLDYAPSDLDDATLLSRKLRDIRSFGGFGEVDFSHDGIRPVLVLNERPLGRTLISMGLRAQSNLDGDSNYGLLAEVSRRPFSSNGGELRLSGEFGTNLGATVELHQPFGANSRFFVQPGIEYRAEEILFDIADFRVGEFWQQAGNLRLRLGRELGAWGVLSAETIATVGRVRPQVTVDPDTFQTEKYALLGVGARFAVDTLDSGHWPLAGSRLISSIQYLESLDEQGQNTKYRLSFLQAAHKGSFGFGFRVRAESVDSDDDEPIEILSLGGFRQLSAFSPNSLPTNRYALASVEVFRRLTNTDQVFSLPLYAGLSVEYANVAFDLFSQGAEENIGSVGVYLGADTPIGPTSIGIGLSDEGRYAVFLNIGTTF